MSFAGMFEPPMRPEHVSSAECPCGAKVTIRSMHAVAVTAQLRDFYAAHASHVPTRRTTSAPKTPPED